MILGYPSDPQTPSITEAQLIWLPEQPQAKGVHEERIGVRNSRPVSALDSPNASAKASPTAVIADFLRSEDLASRETVPEGGRPMTFPEACPVLTDLDSPVEDSDSVLAASDLAAMAGSPDDCPGRTEAFRILGDCPAAVACSSADGNASCRRIPDGLSK